VSFKGFSKNIKKSPAGLILRFVYEEEANVFQKLSFLLTFVKLAIFVDT
jgi:hypothetical protein